MGVQFLQADPVKLTRKILLMLALNAHEIDELQAGAAINLQTLQVLSEKSAAFAKQKNSDESEDHHRDNRVAPEERLDQKFGGEPTTPDGTFSAKKGGGGGECFHGETMRIAAETGNLFSVTIL
jgi:hypothetical protein